MRSSARMSYGYYLLGLSIGILLFWLATCAHADPATHNLPDMQRKMQVWMGDSSPGYVVPGASNCLPTVPSSSLILAAFVCQAYAKNVSTGELLYVSQGLQAVGPLNSGAGMYWLAAHADTTSTVSGWTRQGQSHYLWQKSATQPVMPTQMVLLASATVTTVVTTIGDQRVFSAEHARTHINNVVDYGADPLGIADSTLAFQAAINGVYREIRAPAGTYLVSNTLTISRSHTLLFGAGKGDTNLNFAPATAGKTLFLFADPNTAAMFYCGLASMTLYGGTSGVAFTDVAKTAVQTVHQSEFAMHDVEVLFWHDSSFLSTGLHLNGWELYSFTRVSIQADNPVTIDVDPVAGFTGLLDLDKSAFHDLYLRSAYTYTGGPVTYAPHPCIRVVSKVALFGFVIDGRSICASESGGLYWQETGDAIASSQNITINNFRWEKPTTTATGAYGLYITRTAQQLQSLTIRDLSTGTGGSNGITLTGCVRCLVEHHTHALASGIALAADNNDQLLLLNNFYLAGSTTSFGSMLKVWDWRTDAANPTSGLWVLSTNAAPYVTMRGTYFGTNVTDVLNNYTIGNWTPVLAGLTVAGTNTYSNQTGRYLRLGRLVFISGVIILTAKDAAMDGPVTIQNLPFTSISLTNFAQAISISSVTNVNLDAGYTQFVANIPTNSTYIQLGQGGDNVPQLAIQAAAIAADASFFFTGMYLLP